METVVSPFTPNCARFRSRKRLLARRSKTTYTILGKGLCLAWMKFVMDSKYVCTSVLAWALTLYLIKVLLSLLINPEDGKVCSIYCLT